MSRVRQFLVVALALSSFATATGAQEVCDLDRGDLIAFAVQHRAKMLGLADAALASPPSTQTSAPPGATGGEDPVADASFPALVAVSLGVPTTTSETGAMTFDLTPFAIVAARDPSVIDKQSEYEKYEGMRKIGASLTLGGKGEAFDRDGDGTVDDALSAEDWSDIVSIELRYRFSGSRDRRDRENYLKYFAMTRDPLDSAATAFTSAAARINSAASAVQPQADGLFCPADARALAEAHPDELDPAIEPVRRYLAVSSDALEEIDGAPVWTAVAGATGRAEELGPDRWWLGIRGAGGLGPDQGWTASVDYGKSDALQAGLDDSSRIKVGVEWAALWGKRWIGGDGIRASLSAAYEKWRDVPGADDDEIASLNFKLNYTLTDTISIPLSITWANKTELLQDEAETRGYIGFTFDFDGAMRKAMLNGN